MQEQVEAMPKIEWACRGPKLARLHGSHAASWAMYPICGWLTPPSNELRRLEQMQYFLPAFSISGISLTCWVPLINAPDHDDASTSFSSALAVDRCNPIHSHIIANALTTGIAYTLPFNRCRLAMAGCSYSMT